MMGVRRNTTLLADQTRALSGESGRRPADNPAESVENDPMRTPPPCNAPESSNLFRCAIFIGCPHPGDPMPLFFAAQARARRPRQPAEAAIPSNYFLCRDPGAGFAPSCLM